MKKKIVCVPIDVYVQFSAQKFSVYIAKCFRFNETMKPLYTNQIWFEKKNSRWHRKSEQSGKWKKNVCDGKLETKNARMNK